VGENKFRVWDRRNKVAGYEKWYIGEWFYDYWSASPCWLYSKDGENWTPTFIPHRFKDQYTGLKDKNGKEGYHKDICKDKNGNKLLIEWIATDATFALLFMRDDGHLTGASMPMRYLGECEVIGNISETPSYWRDKNELQ